MFIGKSYERVVCKDGFTLSVQAREACYCEPRNNIGPYTEVEVGYPSEAEPLLFEWMEFMGEILYDDDDNMIEETEEERTVRKVAAAPKSVYGWVPLEVVHKVLEKHGGLVSGELPSGTEAVELTDKQVADFVRSLRGRWNHYSVHMEREVWDAMTPEQREAANLLMEFLDEQEKEQEEREKEDAE